MATDYTKAECDALDRKFSHPDETVICPRCGKLLQFKAGKWSDTVKCETEGCLCSAIRGF